MPGRFWFTHAIVPAIVMLVVLLWISVHHLDVRIADAFFYDADNARWLGAHTWWADTVMHRGGRNVIRTVALASLIVFVVSYLTPKFRRWRRDAGFVLLAIVLSTGIVGAVKSVSNVDCPWDLQHYGGSRPYLTVFAERPAAVPRGACFPGAHSASGFSLLCFYFLFRDRSRRAAFAALGGGIVVGVAFALAQQARGAHFVSHDLTSAAIVWAVLLVLYATLLAPGRRPRLISSFAAVSQNRRTHGY